MPIRPEDKNRYPKNWPEIRERIKARAGDKCEWCGVPNHHYIIRTPAGYDAKHRATGIKERAAAGNLELGLC
jgi:hypothetical protein